MPLQIQVPGKGVAEFPDGITYDQAFESIREDVPDFQPSREDAFNALRQKSASFAEADTKRYLDKEDGGPLQVAYDRAYGIAAGGVGSIAAAVTRPFEAPLDTYRKINERSGIKTDRFEDLARAPFQQAADEAELATSGRAGPVSNFLSGVLGGILPSMAGGVIGGPVGGVAAAGLQQFGDTRKRVRDYYKSLGLPDYEAQSTADQLGLVSGAVTAGVTRYMPQVLGKVPGVGKYLASEGVEGLAKVALMEQLKKSTVGEIAKRVVGSGVGEATEEGVNQFLLEMIESKRLEPNLTWEEIAKRTGMAAAQGFVGGAGVQSLGEATKVTLDTLQQKASTLTRAAERSQLDTTREQSANELAQMVGMEQPHSEQDVQTRNALASANAQIANGFQQEVQRLKQAEAQRQAGQISDPEYMVAVDRFEKARAAERAQQNPVQPPPVSLVEPVSASVESAPIAVQEAPPQSQFPQPTANPVLGAGAASPQIQSGPEINAPAANLSTADKVYNKLDEWDQGMNDQIRSSIFLGTEVAVAKLVLKTAKTAIRAGQAVDAAVRSAIAYAKTKFPDAKLDSAGLEKSIIADLHGVLSGKEEPSSIAQAAEPFVASNESADSKLQEESLYQKQLRMARTDLRGLHDQVKQAALARDIPLDQIPNDPQSPSLAEIAESLGLSGAAVQDLQKRVGFEGRARELKKAIVEKQQVDTAAEKLAKAPKKYAATIAFLQKSSANLQKKISGKQYADVVGRANEIIAQEQTQIELKAKRDALKQQNVAAAITGPVEELRNLIEETPELANQTPAEFLADPLIPDDRKQSVVIRLSSLYREFDYHRSTVDSLLSMEEEKLQRQIDRLTGKLLDTEMAKAYKDLVLEDAKKALSADTTNNPDEFTGGLNPRWLTWFDQNKSQLKSFADSLAYATGDRAIMAEKMLDWMRFGMDAADMPDLRNMAGESWGVNDETLNSIKEALLDAPAIRNAVMALSDSGNEKLAAHQLRAIATAAIGNEGDIAEELFQQLSDRTESERSKLIASARNTKKKLDALRLRIETLRESKALFDKVATSPVFLEGRQTVEESDSSFMKPALSIDANGQFSLNGFKMPDGTEQQAVIAMGSRDSADKGYSRRVAEKLHEYSESAQAYVDGYEAAHENAALDVKAPSPTALGYDTAVYRGLKHALQNELPAILDATAFTPMLNVDNSRIGLMQTREWFTQLDATMRQIPGVFGGVARKALQLYGDAKLKIETVRNDPAFVEIGKLRTAAMDSHPAVGRNYDLYRKEIFNPMANRGRAFGLLKVGDTLYTGHVVTQADIDLVKRAKARDAALIKIAQKYGKGQAQKFGDVEFRRKAGSVGDYGMARRVNRNGDVFVNSLAKLFFANGYESGITWENAGSQTDNPLVELLNSEAENNHMLKSHIEDSALRSDRNITVAPLMRMAYRSLNAALEAGGHVEQVNTVLDLANRLVEYFPSDTPYDPRTYVMEQLNVEFDQIARNALTIIEELNQIDAGTLSRIDDAKKMLGVNRGKSASNIDYETSNNEYTRPAAQLMLPSSYYNYGAITPVEMVNADARAVGERTVELKNAIRASAENLRSVKHILESGTEEQKSGISPDFARDNDLALKTVNGLIRMIEQNDLWLGADYVQPDAFFNTLKAGVGLGIASALSGTSVFVQNAFSAAFGGLILEAQLNRYGRAMLAFKSLQYGTVVIRNTFYALLNAGSKAASVSFRNALDSFRKSNPRLADDIQAMMDAVVRNKFVETISKVSGYAKYSGHSDRSQSIGFSQTKPFALSVINAWQEALTYANKAEQDAGASAYEKSKFYTKAALKTVKATVESALTFPLLTVADAAINATSIWQSNIIADSLKDLSVKWAGDRVAKGMKYDLSNPDFIVKPEEYKATGTIGKVGAADVLAKARNLVKLTGSNLEWALWDYFQRSNGGQDKTVSFWGDREDSVYRTFVGQINANNQTNRPTRAQNDPGQGIMQALTGFSSNVMTVMLQTLTNARLSTSSGRERFKAALRKLLTIIFGLLAASAVGVFARAGVEFTNRLFNNALGRKMAGFEKEYWKGSPSEVAGRVLKDALSVLPYSGALVKMNDGQRQDIASGIFGVSFVNTIFNTLMGLKNLPMEDWGWLLRKSSSMVGASKLVTGNMGDGAASRATINGVNAFASAADVAGLIPVKQSFSQSGGQVMNAKSGILGKLSEAAMSAQMAERAGDTKGVEEANADIETQKARLLKFHTDKIQKDNELRGITSSEEKVAKDAVAAARRDWQDMNPISRALGHAPTESELSRINANLSGTRRAAADLGWSAFERMSSSFPDSRGRVQEPQQMRQVRSGGSGRGGMRSLAGAGRFGYSPLARVQSRSRVSSRRRVGGRSRLSKGVRGIRRARGVRRIRR